jgi:hypothetical protein
MSVNAMVDVFLPLLVWVIALMVSDFKEDESEKKKRLKAEAHSFHRSCLIRFLFLSVFAGAARV